MSSNWYHKQFLVRRRSPFLYIILINMLYQKRFKRTSNIRVTCFGSQCSVQTLSIINPNKIKRLLLLSTQFSSNCDQAWYVWSFSEIHLLLLLLLLLRSVIAFFLNKFSVEEYEGFDPNIINNFHWTPSVEYRVSYRNSRKIGDIGLEGVLLFVTILGCLPFFNNNDSFFITEMMLPNIDTMTSQILVNCLLLVLAISGKSVIV